MKTGFADWFISNWPWSGLEPNHGKLMPAELSGGMVKRVPWPGRWHWNPELLLLDEPTAGLDPDRSQNFVELIGDLQPELGLTVVMVTHDLNTWPAWQCVGAG